MLFRFLSRMERRSSRCFVQCIVFHRSSRRRGRKVENEFAWFRNQSRVLSLPDRFLVLSLRTCELGVHHSESRRAADKVSETRQIAIEMSSDEESASAVRGVRRKSGRQGKSVERLGSESASFLAPAWNLDKCALGLRRVSDLVTPPSSFP